MSIPNIIRHALLLIPWVLVLSCVGRKDSTGQMETRAVYLAEMQATAVSNLVQDLERRRGELSQSLVAAHVRNLRLFGKRDRVVLSLTLGSGKPMEHPDEWVARTISPDQPSWKGEEGSISGSTWKKMEEIYFFDNPSLPSGSNAKPFCAFTRLKAEHEATYLSNHAHPWPELTKNMTNSAMERFTIHRSGDLLFAFFAKRTDLPPQSHLTASESNRLGEWDAFAKKALQEPFGAPKGVWAGGDLLFSFP